MKNIIKFEGMVNLCDAKGKVLAEMANLSDPSHVSVWIEAHVDLTCQEILAEQYLVNS